MIVRHLVGARNWTQLCKNSPSSAAPWTGVLIVKSWTFCRWPFFIIFIADSSLGKQMWHIEIKHWPAHHCTPGHLLSADLQDKWFICFCPSHPVSVVDSYRWPKNPWWMMPRSLGPWYDLTAWSLTSLRALQTQKMVLGPSSTQLRTQPKQPHVLKSSRVSLLASNQFPLGMVKQAYNPSTQEVETGGLWIQI